jgi:hypothetical protein
MGELEVEARQRENHGQVKMSYHDQDRIGAYYKLCTNTHQSERVQYQVIVVTVKETSSEAWLLAN